MRNTLRVACMTVIACLLNACDSTAPTILPIAGRTFDVISIDGRPFPTTFSVLGRFGGCDAIPVKRVTLAFKSDGSFVQTRTGLNDTGFTISGSFVEVTLGAVAVVSSVDTANVRDGVLQIRLTGINCAREQLVATGM